MASALCELSGHTGPALPSVPRATAWKVLVAGGPGAGKTALIGAVTGRGRRLRTEVPPGGGPLEPGWGGVVRAGDGGPATVSTDFGCLTVRRGLPLYLFGAPAHDPFWFLWGELAHGALGAVILADPGELDRCFPAVDYFERLRVPFLVAVNCFPRARTPSSREVAAALDPEYGTPVVLLDARNREAGKETLVRLIEHAVRRHRWPPRNGTAVTGATGV